MTSGTLIPSDEVAAAIERAAAKYRAEQDAEEAQHNVGHGKEEHPTPTQEECWRAWANSRADREEPLDREGFERWWRAEG